MARTLPPSLAASSSHRSRAEAAASVWAPGPRTPSPRALVDAVRSLAVLLGARVHLLAALATAASETRDRPLREALEGARRDLEAGRTFSEALGRAPNAFSPLVVQMVAVGEESGTLPAVLLRLARYLEATSALRRKLMSALVYPAFVMAIAGAATLFMLVVVVPTFAELFRDLGGTLPAPTRALLATSRFLSEHWGLGLLGAVGVGLVLRWALRREAWSAGRERLLLRLPVAGHLYRLNLTARLTRTLGTLLQSGVRLDAALGLLERSERSPSLRAVLSRVRAGVLRGRGLQELLSPKEGDPLRLPPLVAGMLAVGEEAAEMDAMLLYVAEHFEAEVEARLDVVTTLIEPLLMLGIGLVLGSVLIALYLPMFDLVGTVR